MLESQNFLDVQLVLTRPAVLVRRYPALAAQNGLTATSVF
jgi:hypothetical protein